MDADRAHNIKINALQRPKGTKAKRPERCPNGILWILRTGAPWKDLPQRYPPYQTCHRRFQDWKTVFSPNPEQWKALKTAKILFQICVRNPISGYGPQKQGPCF